MSNESGASISACGRYRYDLTRRWGSGDPAVWVMLNPSTADASLDDHTIRKCIGFTERLGLNALTVVNLFAFRARHPKDMCAAVDPIGPENDVYLRGHAAYDASVICAWGPNGRFRNRDLSVLAMLRAAGVPLQCLHVTADGSPGHPLTLGYDRALAPYEG